MSITLQEFKDSHPDAFDTSAVIDEFQKSSILLDNMIWDDTVTAAGSSFVYGYNQVATESGAGVREVGGQYTPSDAKMVRKTADVRILGGTYTVDRAVAKASQDSFLDEVQFQSGQKVKGTKAVFNDLFINGDSDNAGEFDGLNKLLEGKDTVFTSSCDLSSSAKIDTNYSQLIDEVDEVIANMDGEPTMILMNTKMLSIFRAVLRRAGQYQETKDSVGRVITTYGNALLVDLGDKAGSTTDVITGGDIYFVRIALDGVHGVTLKDNLVDVVTPDFNAVGEEQLKGLVEMYSGVALKSSKAAGKLTGITITA